MTRLEAIRILGLDNGASAEGIRQAYRRKAFETHPDRGGSAAEFLKVQAAYEVLNAAGEAGPSVTGLDTALLERLDEVHAAFVRLREESGTVFERTFDIFERRLVGTIRSYRSYSKLKDHAQRDISSLWEDTVATITAFLEEKVSVIADHHETWLQAYLRPVVEAAKYEQPASWFERTSSGALALTAAVALAGASIHFSNYWIDIPAILLGACGIVLPLRYRRRFDIKRLIKGVRLQDVRQGSSLSGFDIRRDTVGSEDASLGGAGVGAVMGGAIFGPAGALIGAALGGVFGWLIGESLEERQQMLYSSVVEGVNRILPDMLEELDRRLSETEEAMINAIQENFKKNVRVLLALMK